MTTNNQTKCDDERMINYEWPYIETSQVIHTVDQLAGLYMIETLTLHYPSLPIRCKGERSDWHQHNL